MVRTAAIFLLGALLTGASFAADSSAIATWFGMDVQDAGKAAATSTDATLELLGTDKARSAYWALTDPIPLATGKSVTLSCRINTPEDMPTNSTAQIRIGLYGVVAETNPDTTRLGDLRGFVVLGGSYQKMWRVELAEHDHSAGGLIYSAGMTNRAMTEAESAGGRGVESRIVITITKKSADQISLRGFWGDVPFSFEVAPLAGDYTHLRAVAVMRGGKSGKGTLTVGSVKLRPE